MSTLRGPELELPDEATVADLVEAGAARAPHATAVVDERGALTYAELEARANQLGHHLRRLGVGAEVPVGVCTERSVELAVAFLGVLKASGACLPLDPTYPAQRLERMLTDAAPPVVLAQQRLTERLPSQPGWCVRLDADWPEVAGHPTTPPARDTRPDGLAYLIYTSGSTGEPKGVELTHRGLVNHHLAVIGLYELAPGDRVVQFCSISFDVSIEELFPTWAAGATVVLRPDDVPVLGAPWRQWLRQAQPTMLNLPTAYWHEWVRDLEASGASLPETLRLVVVGGERALGSAYRSWQALGGDRARWLNAYGPAETSVLATVYEPAPGDELSDGDPPIGRPLANTDVHLLDERGERVAPGDPGDLHIGGVGVARGYRNRPQLTAEHFVPDPFSDRADARLYRTGDRVRLRSDGHLEFVGRLDEQVKVRGFRIECREVEAHVVHHPAVADAVVVAREDRPGDRRLVAYVVTAGDAPPAAELRRFVGERLPPYMVPSAFVGLDALPLSPNGKVDRDALPPPGDPRRDLATAWVAPRTAAEEAVAGIWARILQVDGVGADDDFFALGGHSLQAAQAVAEAREAFGAQIGVGALFEQPTVGGFAAALEARHAHEAPPPPLVPQPREPEDPLPLTLSQEQMWLLERAADPPGLFNVTAQHGFAEPVDLEALRAALAHLVDRHEPLRTSVHGDHGDPHQVVATDVTVPLGSTDLTDVTPADRADALHRAVADQDAAPFDFGEPPLLRAHLYRLGDGGDLLAATFDHLVCDGTSAYVFLSELTAAYDAIVDGRAPQLRPLPVQYGDFALWQRRWLTEERLQQQLAFWSDKLAGAPLGPAIPLDRVPERPTRRMRTRSLPVPPETYAELQRLARATHSTVFVVCAAAVGALAHRLAGTTDVVLGTTLSGRQRAELEGLIGCFHGIGRIRTDLSGDPNFATVVARTRDSVLGLFEHQDIPFMRVRQAVMPHFPRGGPQLLASVPLDFQYFHAAHDEWAPGAGVVERPWSHERPDPLFFRGQLHPLSLTFLDDRTQLWGEVTYKTDFYDETTIDAVIHGLPPLLEAVIDDPSRHLSKLPIR